LPFEDADDDGDGGSVGVDDQVYTSPINMTQSALEWRLKFARILRTVVFMPSTTTTSSLSSSSSTSSPPYPLLVFGWSDALADYAAWARVIARRGVVVCLIRLEAPPRVGGDDAALDFGTFTRSFLSSYVVVRM
jgi:hypothetical protein